MHSLHLDSSAPSCQTLAFHYCLHSDCHSAAPSAGEHWRLTAVSIVIWVWGLESPVCILIVIQQPPLLENTGISLLFPLWFGVGVWNHLFAFWLSFSSPLCWRTLASHCCFHCDHHTLGAHSTLLPFFILFTITCGIVMIGAAFFSWNKITLLYNRILTLLSYFTCHGSIEYRQKATHFNSMWTPLASLLNPSISSAG
jgi:hypothetical protein